MDEPRAKRLGDSWEVADFANAPQWFLNRGVRVAREPRGDLPSKWGLRVVEGIADQWGVELTETGKTVWVEFEQPGT